MPECLTITLTFRFDPSPRNTYRNARWRNNRSMRRLYARENAEERYRRKRKQQSERRLRSYKRHVERIRKTSPDTRPESFLGQVLNRASALIDLEDRRFR